MRVIKSIILASCILALVGCSNIANSKINNSDNHDNGSNKAVNNNYDEVKVGNEQEDNELLKYDNTDDIDFSEVKYIASETVKDERLEEAIINVYSLKPEDIEEYDIRYYYNRIDLNGDNNPETFVMLVEPTLFCGSGGCSALIFRDEDEEYKLVSRFTLVHNPIIVSNDKTNGWRDIIMYVSGGGVESFFSRLKFDGNEYPMNPSVEEEVKPGTKIKGTAIISDDITNNLQKELGISISN